MERPSGESKVQGRDEGQDPRPNQEPDDDQLDAEEAQGTGLNEPPSQQRASEEDASAEEGQPGGADEATDSEAAMRDQDATSAEAPGADTEPEAPADGEARQGEPTGQQDAETPQESEQPAPLHEARIAELEQELEKTKNRLLRIAADFENYRKRMQRDMALAKEKAAESVLMEILPVLDNLERAVTHANASSDPKGLVEGVQLVLRQFKTTMGKFGVEAFDSKGQAFDPTLHEAVGQVESSEHPPGHVVEEWQKGYRMGQRLMRPALVVVSKAPTPKEEASPGEEGRGEVLPFARDTEDAVGSNPTPEDAPSVDETDPNMPGDQGPSGPPEEPSEPEPEETR